MALPVPANDMITSPELEFEKFAVGVVEPELDAFIALPDEAVALIAFPVL
jgi:hypothetical protein